MATRKRNQWLDADVSDDEDDLGYDSEEDQKESRGALAGRSIKRRKVEEEDNDSLDDGDSADDDNDENNTPATAVQNAEEDDISREANGATEIANNLDRDDEDNHSGIPSSTKRAPKIKPLTDKQLAASQKAAKRTGVVYLSRIPPFMKPAALKHFLSPYGDVGRVFLTPEDSASHQRRVRSGGNKKKSFTDGWVEFISKKDAKIVAETLNGNIIGGKKGNFYHDDIWNIKYLTGFKWQHLTEQIANENAERAARLRAEISKTRRENKAFVDNIERAKMLEGMQAKAMAKREKADGALPGAQPTASAPARDYRQDPRRQFKQSQVRTKTAKDGAKSEQPESVKRVLSKIF